MDPELQQDDMFLAIAPDRAILHAAGGYSAMLDIVRERLPAADRWLIGELDERVGANLAAHALAGAAWGLTCNEKTRR